jgi:hypothetical protein
MREVHLFVLLLDTNANCLVEYLHGVIFQGRDLVFKHVFITVIIGNNVISTTSVPHNTIRPSCQYVHFNQLPSPQLCFRGTFFQRLHGL